MFIPTAPLLESVVRGTVVFIALLVMMRATGQRESGGLGITDVLVVVLVAEAASSGLRGEGASMADGLIVVATILFWSVAVDVVAYNFPRLAPLLKGRRKPLIIDGTLNRRLMRREFMTEAEVEAQLRLHGVEDIAKVARAYVEANGMISVFRRDGQATDPVERPC